MSAETNDPGWAGRDDEGRQQCVTCWKWQFPAIHSCPGVPQRGRVSPRLATVNGDPTEPLDDPRVQPDVYVVHPTGYDALVHSDRDAWTLRVVNGNAWGWSVRRHVNDMAAMNRKGEWIIESRGSEANKYRRWPLDYALSLALRYVDSLRINGYTAAEASARVAARRRRVQDADA